MKLIFALLLSLGCSCAIAQAKLNVVVTTADLAAIAREIGGEHIELTTLARPTEDPHFVDPKPSFMVKLNHADALIQGGAELEIGWLPPLVQGARNSKIAPGGAGNINANTGVEMLDVPSQLDRSKGDIHAAGNPHYLVDPMNAKIAARNIANGFSKLDPGAAAAYQANYDRFASTLDAKLSEWLKKLAAAKGESVVAYHDSWTYFANRFGFKINLFLEPKPGIPPTPTHLAEVIGGMKEQHAHVILVDFYLDSRTAETVASRADATVVAVSQFPGAIKGTEQGYVALLDYLVDSIAKAFAAHKP
jgi:zinc/manganese transport system substrate-binding protein